MWSCQAPTPTLEVLVAHRNPPLSELGRLRLARVIVEQGWPVARAAERFQVSRPTAQRWATRYRDRGGRDGRPVQPPHHSPRRTPAPVVRKIVHLRWKQRLGPAQIAPLVGLAASTVHAVLVRCRISRLRLDRATGQPVRRYEHAHPGDLVHVDMKKLGNIPAAVVATVPGPRRRQAATARPTAPAANTAATATLPATASSTPRSMTIPAWPTPRSTPTRPARPPPGSWPGPKPGSPTTASPSSGS